MAYSEKENVKLLISMLKAYNIRHLVLSPGSRNIPFVHMAENDDFFTCYSIVDERSAGFFAIGLIERLNVPVGICCTSGTAVCNYTSAVAEAYYQRLPLVVLTADRLNYFLNQNEDQMIPQQELLKSITKVGVQISTIKDSQDYWYTKNRLNAALLELDHHGKGPVHINFIVEDKCANTADVTYEKPEDIARVYRYELEKKSTDLSACISELTDKKVMVVYGQSYGVSASEMELLESFVSRFNCVVLKDHISNLSYDKAFLPFAAVKALSEADKTKLKPDIIITLNGNCTFMPMLKKFTSLGAKQWDVCDDGILRDCLHNLTKIFEGSASDFLKMMSDTDSKSDNSYYDLWEEHMGSVAIPEPEYSSLAAVKMFVENVPSGCIVHLANSSTVRYANMFRFNENIKVYCNRGTNGIDGSFSAFMGNAVASNEPTFLLIGDLSFFYDMNACWNRYCGKNIRIMLNNNSGAELFHYDHGAKIERINEYIAAEHNALAKGWIESRGFKYLCAHNAEELDAACAEFFRSDSDCPIFLEVFTDKKADSDIVHKYFDEISNLSFKESAKNAIKKATYKNGTLSKLIRKLK